MNDKQYWEGYYKQKQAPFEHSLFAEYCINNFLQPNNSILELGCGNGRDAIYMATHGMRVLGLDQCEQEIQFLSDKYGNDKLKFKCADFSELEKFGVYNVIYSRFTLHAVSVDKENKILQNAHHHLHNNGYLLVEVRGTKNEYFGKGNPVPNEQNAFVYEGHYRRFLDLNETCDKINSANLKIISADEKKGRAPFNGTDYKFIRIIAQKGY